MLWKRRAVSGWKKKGVGIPSGWMLVDCGLTNRCPVGIFGPRFTVSDAFRNPPLIIGVLPRALDEVCV